MYYTHFVLDVSHARIKKIQHRDNGHVHVRSVVLLIRG